MCALKIALVQLYQEEDPALYKKDAAVRHAAKLILDAPHADLYVLPELAPVGCLYCIIQKMRCVLWGEDWGLLVQSLLTRRVATGYFIFCC